MDLEWHLTVPRVSANLSHYFIFVIEVKTLGY